MTRRNSFVASTTHGFRELAPPISITLVVLSLAWYWSSAVSNTLSKAILNAFPYPVTLTLLQFAFVVFWALLLSVATTSSSSPPRFVVALGHTAIARPTRRIVLTVAPMAVFQLSGHIFSHIATSRIPVTLVHTIKGLSPLFTVLAYRFVFGVHYSFFTYLSLVPLSLGVVLACSVEFHGHLVGIVTALVAAIIFVSQNIFSKKLLTPSHSSSSSYDSAENTNPAIITTEKKLDKINLLCYCSGLAFLFTFPIWFYSEGAGLVRYYFTTGTLPIVVSDESGNIDPIPIRTLLTFFFLNGTVHFGQNFLAFQILGLVSPVTYSIASLFKRVFVIVVAIIWFGQELTSRQNWGIGLTFFGLYLYDRAGDASRTERLQFTNTNSPHYHRTLLPIHDQDIKLQISNYSSNHSSARNSNEAIRHSELSLREDVNEKHLLHQHSLVNNGSSTIIVA
ncbi:triose-phosphate transporter family-domain-containing protein [Lipomyces japonicus]|uniref:triose-phosphate transporter family-domain-containing protein n=1 Tax=Lipomyces japonicus TaxID=56871 RepID=UPI0034CFC0B1